MKLKFCGAAGTVTGSCHLLELDNGYKILLDCGLYQGSDDFLENFNREWMFDPSEIDVMVLSHAHIDHAGRIPKLVKDGFGGDIICTSATRDLAAIMLMDSGNIQEQDAKYLAKKKYYTGPTDPLYTSEDAKESLQQFVGIAYNRWFKITEDVWLQFHDAGHILGSASVTLKVKRQGLKDTTVGFSGDIGRPDRPILRDPQFMPELDYLICESTYGGKEHQGRPEDEEALLKIINRTCVTNRGKLIIPAFSVGRTQELIYMMDKLETAGKLPPIEVFVDSPLAINATEIFAAHPECYDMNLIEYMATDPNPFGFRGLNFVRSAEKSKAINEYEKPCVIISASGMMQAGRIRHHLFNHIENSRNTILVVGYCAPGTLGARIRNKPDTVRIFGQEKEVKANIEIMDSFSAHADQGEIIDFLHNQKRDKLRNIFLVHGEEDRQLVLKEALQDAGFGEVTLPKLGETVDI
ncbi:MAG: MBL fold metallo-hydrolase [Cyclobacteriaceae bacterium]